MVRRLVLLTSIAAVGAALFAAPASSEDGFRVDVIIVGGNLDSRLVAFTAGAIESSDADLVVLQMDVGAVLGDRAGDLVALVAEPPLPLAVWVGPAPGVARGGAALVLAAAHIRGAAPGTRIGPAVPTVAGGPVAAEAPALVTPDFPDEAVHGIVEVQSAPIPGLVDFVEPSIGQFVVGIHGLETTVAGRTVVVDTARTEVVDGVERVRPAGPVRFVEPGVIDRILSTGTQPETTFLFLVMGLALAALEFYAVGPGIAAAAAAALLLLAGNGLAILPVWWPAVGAVVVGVALYVIEFQHNDLGWKSVLGTVLLVAGGVRFVVPSPQLATSWWVILLIVAAAAAFFVIGLTTVARARFATRTIGRDHLVGRRGVAEGPIGVAGYVSVDGARWKARATRASGIEAGDPVTVVGVEGIVLRVERMADRS